MAWLDYYRRYPNFGPLLNACISARQGIEYLLFEELLLGLGTGLTEAEYEKCVQSAKTLDKVVKARIPTYERLLKFTKIVASLDEGLPNLISWNHANLMRAWGTLSKSLHWFGTYALTTDDREWLEKEHSRVLDLVTPIWKNMCKGRHGVMHPDDMHPSTREVWNRFVKSEISEETAAFQLRIVRPTSVLLPR